MIGRSTPLAPLALLVACFPLGAAAQSTAPNPPNTWQNGAPGAAPAAAPTPPAAAPGTAAPDTTAPNAPVVLEEDDKANDAAPPATETTASPAATPAASPVVVPQPTTHSPATAPTRDELPDDGSMGSHRDHFVATLGVRVNYVPNSGFDPFNADNALTQISLGLGRTLASDGNLALVGLMLWDWGQTEATARGADTSLDVHRLTLAAEGRYHFFRRLYAFGRIAPGALHWGATLKDRAATVEREDDRWVFATDLSAGAAFEFAGVNRGESHRPRGWVSAEGGYGWSAASQLSFDPSEGEVAPQRSQPIELGELGIRGGFFRVAANLTY